MMSTDELLRTLAASAATPFEQASALPPALYTSPELLAIEKERIFARDWVCPGLAAELAAPGDYMTFTVADQPVFTIRDGAGAIRTFANVCRHRMMPLLEGTGNTGRIVCPYHAWTYDHGGRLIGCPQMQHSPGFAKRDIALPEIRTEIWEGWIYITLNEDALPVGKLLAPLAKITSRYAMADYIPIARQDHIWQTNWKLLTENFMEGYHLPVAHKATVGAWFPQDQTHFPARSHPAFTYQTFIKNETAKYGRAHPANKRLRGRWRGTSVLPTVFPSHMYTLAPDHFWYLSLRPAGTGETHVRFGAALAPEVHATLDDVEADIAELLAFFDIVNQEDRFVVERIYAGAQAPLTTPGRLSWLERELHDFMKYLADRLCGDVDRVRHAAE